MNAIFLCFDDGYFHYAKSCINSLKANYPTHPHVLVHYTGKSDDVLQYLHYIPNLSLIELRPHPHFSTGPNFKSVIYQRLHLWTEAFSSYDTILYLDVDTLVLRPLDALFAQDTFTIFSDHDPNYRIFHQRAYWHSRELKRRLVGEQLPPLHAIDTMANSGVFVLPKSLRTPDNHQLLLSLARTFDPYIAFADQSIISLWCWKRGLAIQTQYEYNCQLRLLEDKKLTIDFNQLAILHYSGLSKPGNHHQPLAAQSELFLLANRLRLHYRIPRPPNPEGARLLYQLKKVYLISKQDDSSDTVHSS
tara:strand:- start:37 stop:948 length:912 start_codon:yes stop_codon:yes gene_type:complete